jgi:hypothetical protein
VHLEIPHEGHPGRFDTSLRDGLVGLRQQLADDGRKLGQRRLGVDRGGLLGSELAELGIAEHR